MVNIGPVGLDTTAIVSNQVSLLATYTEKLCNAICVNNKIEPQYSITYITGTPVLRDTTVFVPISAVITIVTPGECCAAKTQLFTEEFSIAFQGQTAVPASVTVASVGKISNYSNISCCKARGYTIQDSLTVTIA